jgi:hypothetical protein
LTIASPPNNPDRDKFIPSTLPRQHFIPIGIPTPQTGGIQAKNIPIGKKGERGM